MVFPDVEAHSLYAHFGLQVFIIVFPCVTCFILSHAFSF